MRPLREWKPLHPFGYVDKDGYRRVPACFFKGGWKCGYVVEHRELAAFWLQRSLASDELVHHRDKDKQNNRRENLVLTDRSTHQQFHRRIHEKEIKWLSV